MKIPKPTRWQYFLASNWWMYPYFTASAIAGIGVGLPHNGIAIWESGRLNLPALVCVGPVFAAAGYVAGFVFFGFALRPILIAISPHLDAEFRKGDYVLVLSPKHRGKILRVYSKWQQDTFRVDLGPEAEARYKDILSPWEVLRVEPDNAPASNDVALPPARE